MHWTKSSVGNISYVFWALAHCLYLSCLWRAKGFSCATNTWSSCMFFFFCKVNTWGSLSFHAPLVGLRRCAWGFNVSRRLFKGLMLQCFPWSYPDVGSFWPHWEKTSWLWAAQSRSQEVFGSQEVTLPVARSCCKRSHSERCLCCTN